MREGAGLTGIQLAERLGQGWSNTKVSKMEHGRQAKVTRAEVTAWAEATGHGDPAELADLFDLLEEDQTIRRRWAKAMREGAAPVQLDLDERTRAANRVREVTILLVSGFLQTEPYARCIAEQAASINETTDVDAATQARLKRQGALRDGSGRTFELIMTEAGLRTLVCPRAVMAGQLHQLMAASYLPNVTLGIIPQGVELALTPLETFMMLDGRAEVETYGEQVTLGEDQSRRYSEVFDRLMAEAVTGDEARALITAAIQALQ
jgi:transcriptional regulator with XRE-family HTH domain